MCVCAGAPLAITEDLLTTFNISLVVRGSVSETGITEEEERMRYSEPKRKNIMRCALAFLIPDTKHALSLFQVDHIRPGPSIAWCRS